MVSALRYQNIKKMVSSEQTFYKNIEKLREHIQQLKAGFENYFFLISVYLIMPRSVSLQSLVNIDFMQSKLTAVLSII